MTTGDTPCSTPSWCVIAWAGWESFSCTGIPKMSVSTRRILALWWPRLSIDRLIRKAGRAPDAPLVVSGRANSAYYGHALEPRAERLGLYKGQPLANTRAMVEPLTV